jgi:hypothetical protein
LKIVPHFLILAGLFFSLRSGASDPAQGPARLDSCGLALELPPGFVIGQSGPESLRAQTGTLPRWNLIVYCVPNQFRTDRNDPTLSAYRQGGDYLRAREELELPGGFSAVIFRRTPASQPVQRIEALFSSREFQYHFVLVPDNRNVDSQEWKRMQDTLAASLRFAQIANQVPAITEQEYRVRLGVLGVLALAVCSASLWLLLRRVLRRKKI